LRTCRPVALRRRPAASWHIHHFRVTAPPAANTLFGRSADSTLVAACTNPAALGGGEGDLNGYFDAEGRTAMPMAPSDPWTVGGQPIETPMVRVVGLLKGQCTRPLAQALANPFWR
jgi:hypothetical protein